MAYHEHLYLENLNKTLSLDKTKEVIIALGKLKSKRAYQKLLDIALNENKDISLRLVAIMALTEIGISAFIKEFFPLEEKEEEILELLIMAVGELHSEEYLEDLRVFFNYKNFEIKKHVIEALSKIDSINSLKLMIYFYNDKDYKIKELVKQALYDSPIFKVYIETIDEDEILNIITLIPIDKAEKLIHRMINETKNSKILRILITAIGDLKLKNGFQLLKELYKVSEEKNLKLKIIGSCQRLKNSEKKEFLLDIIKDEDRDLKVKAILSLNELSKEEEIQSILEDIAINTNEWWMARKLSIMSLNKLKKEKFYDLLKKEQDQRVLRTLIQQIGDLGEKYGIKLLESFIESKDIEIKKVSVLALSKLGSKVILETLVENKELRDSLKPDSLKAIINFNDKRVSKILIELIKSREEAVYDICFNGLAELISEEIRDTLCNFVRDKEVKREIRGKALMILASYNDSVVEKTLKNILDDETEWWMLKKMAIIICGELKLYSLTNEIIDYAEGIDSRIKKSAKEVCSKIYEDYILRTLELEKSSVYDFASRFSKLF